MEKSAATTAAAAREIIVKLHVEEELKRKNTENARDTKVKSAR